MAIYDQIQTWLRAHPRKWLVTGVAGFIGSNLLEALLRLDQTVVGLDNFSTGHRRNLDEVQAAVSFRQWARFRLLCADIRDPDACAAACAGNDVVLHQAALGSVPRSLQDPVTTNANNVSGFLNILVAARDAGVGRFIYAASSSTYGDHPGLPKVEESIGRPLSPYAVTKYVNELYADVFARSYGLETIGLRYFNIFGQRQDPDGAYAAVIPKWFAAMLAGGEVHIYGDGKTSRDFCHIDNCVQANILAAATMDPEAVNQVYNVACGERTTLRQLFENIRQQAAAYRPAAGAIEPVYRDYRPGDVRHSLADITKAAHLLGYVPKNSLASGLAIAAPWYARQGQTIWEAEHLEAEQAPV